MATSKNPIIRFVQEAFMELHKVTWPTRKEAINLFFIVIVITLILIAFITVIDWFFASSYNFLIQ